MSHTFAYLFTHTHTWLDTIIYKCKFPHPNGDAKENKLESHTESNLRAL